MWQKIIANKYYTAMLLVSVFFLGLFGSYFGLRLFKKPKLAAVIATEPTPFIEPVQTFAPVNLTESYNAVLLGSGGAGHSGGNLTDSIIVVSISPADKRATLISIPRDLWVPGNYKINAAATNVGIENLKGVLQNITGLKIEKYASVDFSGLIKLIDTLGGIEVDIPNTFDDYFYPVKGLENETCGKTSEEIALYHQKYSGFELEKQFTCRYEHIHYDKGIIKIDGASVLKLARSRHGDSDFGRSSRQFAILKGLFGSLWKNRESTDVAEVFSLVSKTVQTDLTLPQAKSLVQLLGNPGEYDIDQVQLTENNVLTAAKSGDGQYILIPKAGPNDFSEIKKYISKK